MGIFTSSSLDLIVRIIACAQKAEDSIRILRRRRARKLLILIQHLDAQQLAIIQRETGSGDLVVRCREITKLTQEALQELEDFNTLSKATELIEKIKQIEEHEILRKVKRYLEIKEFARKNGTGVDRITDGVGKKMDPLIKPLVVILTYFGFKTEQSCGGHSDHGTSYPWVSFNLNTHFEKLSTSVQKYNQRSSVKWSFWVGSASSSIIVFRKDGKLLITSDLEFLNSISSASTPELSYDLNIIKQEFAIFLTPKFDLSREYMEQVYAHLVKRLERSVYIAQFRGSDPSGSTHLRAEGNDLTAMQSNIDLLVHYLIENAEKN